jgi:hypothetical protein
MVRTPFWGPPNRLTSWCRGVFSCKLSGQGLKLNSRHAARITHVSLKTRNDERHTAFITRMLTLVTQIGSVIEAENCHTCAVRRYTYMFVCVVQATSHTSFSRRLHFIVIYFFFEEQLSFGTRYTLEMKSASILRVASKHECGDCLLLTSHVATNMRTKNLSFSYKTNKIDTVI